MPATGSTPNSGKPISDSTWPNPAEVWEALHTAGTPYRPWETLTVVAVPLFKHQGFTNTDIATVTKVFGFWIALGGTFAAGFLIPRIGMMASLLGFCLEQLVIDNDIIGATQRTIKGIDVSDEHLSIETIRKTCLEGPGHYLGSEQTLQLMQTEYVYPMIGDRSNPKEWVEQGRPDSIARAQKKLKSIMNNHFSAHIPPHVDDAIRAKFPVRLDRAHMRKG